MERLASPQAGDRAPRARSGWSLPAHRHHNEAETIHIIEGDSRWRWRWRWRRRSTINDRSCPPARRFTSPAVRSIRVPTSAGNRAPCGAVQPRRAGELLPGGWRAHGRQRDGPRRHAGVGHASPLGVHPRTVTLCRGVCEVATRTRGWTCRGSQAARRAARPRGHPPRSLKSHASTERTSSNESTPYLRPALKMLAASRP